MENLEPLFNIARLIALEKTGKLSDSEHQTLHQWVEENEQNKHTYLTLKNNQLLLNQLDDFDRVKSSRAFYQVEQQVLSRVENRKKIKLLSTFVKYAAAVLILVISGYFIYHYTGEEKEEPIVENTIKPGEKRAILLTSTREKIVLDSSSHQRVLTDMDTEIMQKGALLSYTGEKNNKKKLSALVYNTLITPVGSEYSLVLADGTEVLLNAGSEIKYPVEFLGHSREVWLRGEAYFNVTTLTDKPFIVFTGNMQTIVRGTKFNVSAYGSDTITRTTLVEGNVDVAVKKGKTTFSKELIPGQQFNYNRFTGNSITREVNVDQYIAWTKGRFIFENTSIEEILESLSRWYNFTYEFKNDYLKNERFTLSLHRYDNINKILELLSVTSNLQFEIKENIIHVSTKQHLKK